MVIDARGLRGRRIGLAVVRGNGNDRNALESRFPADCCATSLPETPGIEPSKVTALSLNCRNWSSASLLSVTIFVWQPPHAQELAKIERRNAVVVDDQDAERS